MAASDYVPTLYAALDSPHGLVIQTDDAERLRQLIYAAKRIDPIFAALSLIIAPGGTNNRLWIVKKMEIVSVKSD
tara:strand:+ start:3298 stop:3522 length:225 start_codon:yes stop_codon:yes gene_type:complete